MKSVESNDLTIVVALNMAQRVLGVSVDALSDMLGHRHDRARDVSALADRRDQFGELHLRALLRAAKGVEFGQPLAGGQPASCWLAWM